MKRNAAFIGSPSWVARDVTVHRFSMQGRPVKGTSGTATVVRDVPSSILIADYQDSPVASVLAQLAHRVRQLA